MTQTELSFDSYEFNPEMARLAKEQGIGFACTPERRRWLLEMAKSVAKSYSRQHGKASSDDVRKVFMDMGLDYAELGNSAGGVFKGHEWECIGVEASKVVSRHGNTNRIWRWKGNVECR